MEMNFLAIFVAALSTLVVGFIWYGPMFGKAWMTECGFKEEDLKGGNMLKIFGLTFVFSFMLAMMMNVLVIHEFGALGMVHGDPTTALPSFAAFMADYAGQHRTFGHGALHGAMSGIFLALPLFAINGLFERRSWKYIFIHAGYWTVCMTIMGAIICGWV